MKILVLVLYYKNIIFVNEFLKIFPNVNNENNNVAAVITYMYLGATETNVVEVSSSICANGICH